MCVCVYVCIHMYVCIHYIYIKLINNDKNSTF